MLTETNYCEQIWIFCSTLFPPFPSTSNSTDPLFRSRKNEKSFIVWMWEPLWRRFSNMVNHLKVLEFMFSGALLPAGSSGHPTACLEGVQEDSESSPGIIDLVIGLVATLGHY